MTNPSELIVGAVDMHLHSGPALTPRGFDHVQVVRSCAEAKMRAIVIKDQHVPTGSVCQILQKYFVKEDENFNVYGGLILGNTQGGISPSVVEAAIGYGTKVVWMPVLSSRYNKERMTYLAEVYPEYRSGVPKPQNALKYDPPMSIISDSGKLLPEITDILELIKDANIVLATGHLSRKETSMLLDEAVKKGIKKIVITHPEYFRDYTNEEMREFTNAGFYVEHIITPIYSNKQTYDNLYALVKNNGVARTFISSDLGQVGRPLPVDGLLAFIAEMQKRGMSDEDIRRITGENQRFLLGLDD